MLSAVPHWPAPVSGVTPVRPCFLASEACAYLTGTRVTVDGGALLPVVPENDMNGGSLLPLQIHETEEHK